MCERHTIHKAENHAEIKELPDNDDCVSEITQEDNHSSNPRKTGFRKFKMS